MKLKVRTKRKLVLAVGFMSALYAYGLAGGIECELISLEDGMIRIAVCCLITVLALYKSGAFNGSF